MKEHTHINNALSFIQKAQEKDGSFLSFSFKDGHKENYSIRSTTFYTACILSLLDFYKGRSEVASIQRKGIDFLLSEKNDRWSFNYWKKDSKEYTSLRCPDDLDVICAVLLACFGGELERLNEHALSDFIKHLTTTEYTPGGPYNTWIVPHFKGTPWEDMDLAVNSSILYILRKKEVDLPEIQSWMDRSILSKNYQSRYYSPALVLYFISRSYRGSNTDIIREHLLEYTKNTTNTLEKAALLSSYIRLGGSVSKIKKDIEKLLALQANDGSWNLEPFFTEQIQNSVPVFSGSNVLTTAFCLETVFLYSQAQDKIQQTKEAKARLKHADKVHTEARKYFTEKDIKNSFNSLLSYIERKDHRHEISLLSYDFYTHMKNKTGIPEMLPYQLGALNTLGWIGYTVCDNIIDEEHAYISHLPIALRCIREVSTGFKKYLPKETDYAHVQYILDAIEHANYEERNRYVCEVQGSCILIPDIIPLYETYDILAKKSLGHALGPITLILNSRHTHKEKYVDILKSFFTYYIIARQLNDDAHDWLSDLERGFINSSGSPLLTTWRQLNPDTILDLSKETEILKEIFWTKTIDTVTEEILYYIKKARMCIKKMDFLEKTSFLEEILFPLEQSAYKAKRERDESLTLMNAYQDN